MIREWENPYSIMEIINVLKNKEKYYKKFKIPKKNGSYRLIQQPTGILYSLMSYLLIALKKKEPTSIFASASFAFSQNKNIVDNAQLHTNKKYVINLDLKDFFNSIDFKKVCDSLIYYYNLNPASAILYSSIFTYRNSLPTGAPTSPFLSNLVTYKLDLAIARVCDKNDITYSRYADDLTFSTNSNIYPKKTLNQIRYLIKVYGYEINHKKFRVFQSNKRQLVTGLIVNDSVNIKKEDYKLVRAMIYNWKHYGYEKTNHYFRLKFNNKNLIEYLRGKLNFFKMVLGDSNPRYIYLREDFNKLIKLHSSNKPENHLISYKIYSCIDKQEKEILIVIDETGKVFSKNKIRRINIYHDYSSFDIYSYLKKRFNTTFLSVSEVKSQHLQKYLLTDNNWIVSYINKLTKK